MSLSSRLQTKVNANRAQREALAAKNQSFLNRCFAVGLALGLGGGVLAIVAGMRQVASPLAAPVAVSVAAPVAESAPINYVCTLPDGGKLHMTPTDCNLTKTPGTAEWEQRQSELAGIREQNEAHAAYEEASRAEVNSREAEKRADCRAGRIDRDTCNQLVWDWETRI